MLTERQMNAIAAQKALAFEIINVRGLIREHFKSFNGKRINISSGAYSAVFNSAWQEFLEEVKPNTSKSISIYRRTSSQSVWISFELRVVNGTHVEYWSKDIYVGGFNPDNPDYFEYGGDEYLAQAFEALQEVLAYPLQDIKKAVEEELRLRQELQRIKNSLPVGLRTLVFK